MRRRTLIVLILSGIFLFALGLYTANFLNSGSSGKGATSTEYSPYAENSAKSNFPEKPKEAEVQDSKTNDFEEGSNTEVQRYSDGVSGLLEIVESENNPVLRYASLAEAMKQLTPENLDQVLACFESIPFGYENSQDYRMLLYAWSQFDPLSAIDYCRTRASGIGAGFAVSGVLEGWAAQNPLDAKAWVENPENAGMAKLYNFGLVRGWASTDLAGATEYVGKLTGGEEVGKLVGILAEQYNKQGFSVASAWAEQLKKTKQREAAFTSLSRRLSRDQPERVAEWLDDYADQKFAVKAFDYLGKKWSETDPQAAISYFSGLSAGKAQESGIKSVIGNWAKQDPLAAGEWLNQRPEGAGLDSALSVYASIVSAEDAGVAMEWAISITGGKLQQKTIRSVGQEWYRQDKEAVEKWLPESGLSEEMMNSIRKPPKKNWWQQLSEK